MSCWKAEDLVFVSQFTRQPEGNEVVIGCLNASVFLVLSDDAIEVLDWLSTGKTVGEARFLYIQKYKEIPNLEDLLDLLFQKGFVRPRSSNIETLTQPPKKINYYFDNFSLYLSQLLFGHNALICYGFIIGVALLIATINPIIIPKWNAYFFPDNFALMALVLMLMDSAKVFLHEVAHLLAARAVGVHARMGISNRLWVLVAETDMTGIWSIPKKHRYLPLLAGALIDAVSASFLILCLFAEHQRFWDLSPLTLQLLQAMLLSYFLGLLWQCYFFVRTDFYYVITNFCCCTNLMQDTEIFLSNYLARFIPWIKKVDRSQIGFKEMRVIRWYALVWLLGRTAAFASLLFIGTPLCWHYLLVMISTFTQGYQLDLHKAIDILLIALMLVPQLIGFGLWLINSQKQRR